MENPYASPTATVDAAMFSPSPGQLHRFRPSPTLVTVLVALLWIGLAFHGVGGALEAANLVAFQGAAMVEPEPGSAAFSLTLGYVAVGLLQGLIYLATVVPFGIWLNRANHNARALGAVGMETSPGWTVGWFFVPFANLFKPYQAVSEIERASRLESDGTKWKSFAAAPLLGWWWGAWLLANFIGRVSARLSEGETAELQNASTVTGIIASGMGIALCLLAIKLVRHIHGLQLEKHTKQTHYDAALTSSGGSNQFVDRTIL